MKHLFPRQKNIYLTKQFRKHSVLLREANFADQCLGSPSYFIDNCLWMNLKMAEGQAVCCENWPS